MAKKAALQVGSAAVPTRLEQPIILIRGFGGLSVEDEKKIAYQGFNDGTVYPQKRGENYIYEGLILRFMKSTRYRYQDTTNVVGYYGTEMNVPKKDIPPELKGFDHSLFSGHKVVIDPGMALQLLRSEIDPVRTLWVFRYYDLDDREDFSTYGKALVRLIDFVRALSHHKNQQTPKVNIIAHSMGGLIVRHAVQREYTKGEAPNHINKIVTLGTPHKGIAFQLVKNWIGLDAATELEYFNPDFQADKKNSAGFYKFKDHFPPERVLTVVGTNYRTYGPVVASWLNRAFSVPGEFGANYNRSDGLVKQDYAQLPGAPRTFVHKCHGGPDSLVTSREAFEVATRFMFGNVKVRLNLVNAKVRSGFDVIGKSEFFFGVCIKPRRVDFDLFHQSAEAENCYGPFDTDDFTNKPAFDWAGDNRLIWEGWLDTTAAPPDADDIVMRFDVYVGERDSYGFGHSDKIVFRKQYYVRAVFNNLSDLDLRTIELHAREELDSPDKSMKLVNKGWEFQVGDSEFEATMRLSFELIET
jgi:pimeloyl-ACP methyl ester carboxylesterase